MSGELQSGQLADNVVTIFREPFELNNDQIKALPTTSVLVVPEITEKILSFVKATMFIDVRSGAYTNIAADPDFFDVQFAYASGNTASGPALNIGESFADTADIWVLEIGAPLNVHYGASFVIGNSAGLPERQSQALRIKATNPTLGNLTGGHANNRIWGSVSYEIIDV